MRESAMRSPFSFLRALSAGAILCCAVAGAARAQLLPYQNPSLSPQERAADLVGRMTLEEKVSQMTDVASGVERLGIPAYNWWNEAMHGVAR